MASEPSTKAARELRQLLQYHHALFAPSVDEKRAIEARLAAALDAAEEQGRKQRDADMDRAHVAWRDMHDALRRERDAAHARGVEEGRREERARCVAYLRRPCNDPAHHPAWCQSCELRGDDADAIECGAHSLTTEDTKP